MPDKIQILYDAVSSEYNLGSFNEFKSKMADPGKRKVVYDAISKDYNLGTFDEFSKKISPSGPVPAARPAMPSTLPTFQEQMPMMQTNRFTEAVKEDKKKSGSYIGAIHDSFVSAIDPIMYAADELFIDSYEYLSGKKLDAGTKKGIRATTETIREIAPFMPKKTQPKEYVQEVQGGWDMRDGFGVKDMKALGLMGSRVAGDLAIATAAQSVGVPMGSTYFIQGVGSGYQEYNEMVDKGIVPEDKTAKNAYALTTGVINGLLEKFAFDKIFGSGPAFNAVKKKVTAEVLKQVSKATTKVTVDTIEKTGAQLLKKELSGIGRKAQRAGFAAGVEAITEGSQTGLEEGAKFLTNAIQGSQIFDEEDIKKNIGWNIFNAAVAGGLMGGPMGIANTMMTNVDNTLVNEIANAKNENELNNIIQELEQSMKESNASDEEIDAMRQSAVKYNDISKTIPQSATPEARANIIGLIDRRNGIDEKMTNWQAELEQIDESMRPDVEAEMSTLVDAKDMINDEIRENAAGGKFKYFEDKGKFFKQFENTDPVEITKSRFELQNIKDNATTKSQEQVQESGPSSDISQPEGTQVVEDQAPNEPDAGYRYIVSEEGDEVPITALVNKKVRINGEPAILYKEGRRIVARVIGTNRILDTFGTEAEMMNALPEQFGIEVDETVVSETPSGGYRVEGQDLRNQNENPMDAISYDQNGKVMNVVLTTPAGKRRKFRGAVAQDLAYQITLKEALKNEDDFEAFLEQEYEQELENARLQAAAQEQAARAAEPVPEPAQAEPTVEPAAPSTTVPTYGRITVDRDDSRPVKGKLAKKLVADAKRVLNSIKNLGDFSVNVHDQNSFEQAILEATGSTEFAASRGFYITSNGEIHVNIDNAAPDTVLHEGFHPILDFMSQSNPQVVNDLFNELSAIPEAAGIIEMVNEQYDGEMTQKKEAITNFVAGVANGDIVVNPSNFAKIRRFIANLLKKLGLPIEPKVLLDVNNPTKLVELSKFISEVFETGNMIFAGDLDQAARVKTITFNGIDLIVGDETQDPVTVSNIAVVDPIQFEKIPVKDKVFKKVDIKWAVKGLKLITPKEKSRLYDVLSNSGGALVVINSDATGVGKKSGVLRQGGIGYTFIEQNVQDNIGFAASTDSKQTAFFKAVQEAANIRDERFPNMKGKPVAVFVMVQTPEVMFGNAYGADYFIDAISNALSHNEIKLEDAKSDIIDYFNSIKDTNDTGRKYANSIDALIGLIKNSDLKSAKDKKKVYDLLISNRENKDDKSAKFGFDARRVLFGQFFNKIALAGKKPGGRLRDILDKDGFNHKGFYGIYGDENIMKSLEGRTEGMRLADGGFTMTGFFVDPTMSESEFVSKSKAGTYQHKQFNGRFFGENPFVLDGKYYVNEAFPEARFIDENGKPIPVSTAAGGSMYPRTKTSPETTLQRAREVAGIDFQRMAPNGKPSNLTAKQYEQVRTPAFKKWFGDWENDPANASKVVDENGEPRVVYHGTNATFDEFKKEKLGEKNWMADSAYMGFFFAGDKKTSETYTGMNSMDLAGVSFGQYDDIINKYKPELDKARKAISDTYNTILEEERANADIFVKDAAKVLKDRGLDDTTINAVLGSLRERNIDLQKVSERSEEENDRNGNSDRFAAVNKKIYEEVDAAWRKKTGATPRIMELFLNIKNPSIVDYTDVDKTNLPGNIEEAIGTGKDGVMFNNLKDGAEADDIFVALEPNQIKSATENVGTFSTEDARIQFQKGPLILRHGGETKIKSFDESKIKGGARGELGYGFYFSGDTKYKDYGKETTSIDASSLNIINENSMPQPDLVERLLEWNKSLPESSFGLGKKEISKYYIDTIQKVIKDRPSYSISDVMKTVNEKYPASRESLWSEMMAGIGIDGMAAVQGDGRGNVSIRQAVLYPQDKLNSLIVEEPQFQKATPTKDTRKGVAVKRTEIVSPRLKAKAQNLFTSSGVLGQAIRTFKEQMGGELTAEMKIAERSTNEVLKLMEKYKGVISTQDIDNYLTGNATTKQFPLDLATKLTEMRVHIDGLTGRLIDLGVITAEESKALYENNKGRYMLRSYELFNRKDKGVVTIDNVTKRLKNVDQAKVDKALDFLEKEIAKENPNLTKEELRQEAISQANSILSDEDMSFGGRNLEGSLNTKSLSKRSEYLDKSPAIRELMGEYTDPVYRYYSSIFKLAGLTSERAYLNNLKAEGMGKFLFEKPTGEAVVRIEKFGKKSKAIEPLGGLYTYPEIHEALLIAEREKAKLYETILGHVRIMKTVYNPATHVKNVLGSLAFSIANGHWLYAGKAFSYIKKANRAKLIELIDILNREGVLNNNIGAGELNQYFDKFADVNSVLSNINSNANKSALSYLGGKAANLKKIPNALKKAYAIEDDIFKVLGFVNEANMYAKAEYGVEYDALTDTQRAAINKLATEHVKSFYPTFSRVPKFVKKFSKAAFLGNFLSFPVESVRVSYNTIAQGVKEIRSDNPKIKAIGANRLAGSLLYNMMISALPIFAAMASGDDDDKEEGYGGLTGYLFDTEEQKKNRLNSQLYRAPWNKQSNVLTTKFSEGKLVYSDIGSIDSYGYQREVWSTFWDNMSDKKGFNKAMAATLGRTISPFIDIDMTVSMFANLLENKDESGNMIANLELPWEKRAPDYGMFVLKKVAPGAVNSLIKGYNYYQAGEMDKVSAELASQLVRTYNVDIKKSFQNYVYASPYEENTERTGFKKRLDNAEMIYTRIKNSKYISPEEKEEQYKIAVDAYKRVLMDTNKYYEAAVASGVDASELTRILMNAKLGDKRGQAEVLSIVQNRYDFPDEVYIRR